MCVLYNYIHISVCALQMITIQSASQVLLNSGEARQAQTSSESEKCMKVFFTFTKGQDRFQKLASTRPGCLVHTTTESYGGQIIP